MEKQKKLTIFLFIVSLLQSIQCINNGAGLTPPMGWITDKSYGCNINETYFQQQASRLIQTNLANKGYKFVILDGCWQNENRNQISGEINEDLNRFPSGIQNLSKSIHNKGLKFGISSDVGIKTCYNKPGSYGYQKIDAIKFSQWQVDYLKYDNCNQTTNQTKFRYYLMQKSLNETKRSIFFALNQNTNDRIWQWGSTVANSWRTVADFEVDWNSFLLVLQKQIGLEKYASIGGWNDPGPLMIQSNSMTYQQKQSQFVFWCIWKAPLIIKDDLGSISPQILEILTNQELIAINQDSLGIQAKRLKLQIGSQFKRQVWGGLLSGNNYVIVFFNRGQSQTTVSVSLKKDLSLSFSSYTQRDPIRHASVGISNQDVISVSVASHSVQVRVLTVIKQPHLMFQ